MTRPQCSDHPPLAATEVSPLLPSAAPDNAPPTVKRRLEARHLSMIAMGGTIGTGLFVGSGATIAVAGPVGALVAYLVVGILVFFVVTRTSWSLELSSATLAFVLLEGGESGRWVSFGMEGSDRG
ncbi:hypothetical protein BDK51DRAFT_41850 [Blyttiomyces helicus]|uniref:DOMON domain-containing protein n=1 Tax=Blyttiomyces helicus TaxID=388810 RepID=A0A4P9WA73_9FUNG|nr:hypothetical protein BDK51DRAFT_41850 [Blyttiomyces helicus]|eukprot:RKO89481.1 hypothetical protein BDK51DRAFT_41850 [Blyttiomyces helicus]